MGKKKILIVDDEVVLTRLVRLTLEATGDFEVRVEHEGIKGVKAAQEMLPDFVLLDMIMPDIEGSEVAKQIKANEATRNVPIAFLTATLSREEAGPGGSHIMGYPFIAKPVSGEELIAFIKKVMQEKN